MQIDKIIEIVTVSVLNKIFYFKAYPGIILQNSFGFH